MSALSAAGIRVALGRRVVVDDFDLDLKSGEVVALVGPNGAGKTTLLRALAGLLPLVAGRILLGNRPSDELSAQERALGVAYLPQGGGAHWPLAVQRIVELGRLPHRKPFAGPSARDDAAIARAVRAADIDGLVERPFDQLSGGEKARVLLARALAVEASVLLADEPVAALDPAHQLHVMEILRERALAGAAIVVVLHDLVTAARFSDRIVLMDRGKAVAAGPPASVLTKNALAEVYGVEAIEVGVGEARFAMPWRRVATDEARPI